MKRLSSPLVFGHLSLCGISNRILCNGGVSTVPTNTTHCQFFDGASEVELRLDLRGQHIQTSKDVYVDAADDNSLIIRVQNAGSLVTLMETNCLDDKIMPAETIWYIDDDQLVVNLKKQDFDLKCPDIVQSWESLTSGVMQLLKGASIYLVGDSTEINQKIAWELAVDLGYMPLDTKEPLETFAKQSVDSWMIAEETDAVADAEGAILESLVDEDSAKEEARRHFQDGSQAYSNADVVVELGGWDAEHSKAVAQASFSAVQCLILSDKMLPVAKAFLIKNLFIVKAARKKEDMKRTKFFDATALDFTGNNFPITVLKVKRVYTLLGWDVVVIGQTLNLPDGIQQLELIRLPACRFDQSLTGQVGKDFLLVE